ncbi:MAG: hypothetical protein ABSG92_00020 [Conexivisphaerales archaeon]
MSIADVKAEAVRAPLLDLRLSGIVSSRMRHVIKRYLKRSGFRDVDVVHLMDGGDLGVRLAVYGKLSQQLSAEGSRKLEVLEEAILETLSQKVDGRVPHPSNADSELLRMKLSAEEPSLKRVFYKMA